MASTAKPSLINALANQRAEDYMWGIPESPEFSVLQRLISEIKTHESAEERWLTVYKKIAGESDDPITRFLLNLIIADEERHHQIIGRMISSLKDDLAASGVTRPSGVNAKAKMRAKELTQAMDRFLEVERHGIREYKKLIKASERFHQKLFGLFCRAIIQDSMKHIDILQFLRSRLRAAQRAKKKATA